MEVEENHARLYFNVQITKANHMTTITNSTQEISNSNDNKIKSPKFETDNNPHAHNLLNDREWVRSALEFGSSSEIAKALRVDTSAVNHAIDMHFKS